MSCSLNERKLTINKYINLIVIVVLDKHRNRAFLVKMESRIHETIEYMKQINALDVGYIHLCEWFFIQKKFITIRVGITHYL